MSQKKIELREELYLGIKAAREAVKRDLRAEIRALRTEVSELNSLRTELRTELSEHTLGINFMNGVFEEMRKNYDTAKTENAALKNENRELQAELKAIRNRLADAESRLLLSEQYSRNKNIEIKGIEESPDEKVTDIGVKLDALTGVPVTAEDIEACHHVPSKSKPNNIVVQFSRRQKRDALLEKARKLRLNNTDFGNTSPSSVFVNDHLCPVLRRLPSLGGSKKKSCRVEVRVD